MKLNPAHYLLGCRFDNWIRLLVQNRFRILPRMIPQTIYITLVALVLFPFALLERCILSARLRKNRLEKDPVFILGHWRSGTTFLQNLMTRDPQFGWCDPVSTNTFNNSVLLRPLLARVQKGLLGNARPMDNMKYGLDMPMEDVFAMATISPYAIIHMMPFPHEFHSYLRAGFVDDLSEAERQIWRKDYRYVLNKISYIHKNKQLVLKSPDNTIHIHELIHMFPDARYVNIHRDPYTTIQSTIYMFQKQRSVLQLGPLPEGDYDELEEDYIIGIFERMYRELFDMMDQYPEHHFTEVAYENLVKDPEGCLKKIYQDLEIDGYDEAYPKIKEYIDSQKNYVKNSFHLSPRLQEKIESRLGFYFEHYAYPYREAQ